MNKLLYFLFISIPISFSVSAQKNTANQFPCNEADIPSYTAHKISKPPVIDGKLDEVIWKNAPQSTRFKDLISGEPTQFDTKASVLWDEKYLYVAYRIEEPNVKATLIKRDAPIYNDNDVELFIAGTDGYYEFEINSFGTVYDVLFFWKDVFEKKGYAKMPELDSSSAEFPNFKGVSFQHPRGDRIGFINWNLPGFKSAVHVDGTINDSTDTDKGWTVELAIPWKGLELIAKGDNRKLPPQNGDTWRMDFSRFNTYKKSEKDAGGWAWSSHGVWDSHVPECFTIIHFSDKPSK